MEDGSKVIFLVFYGLFLFLSSSTSESDGQLSSPQRVLRCGILCSPVFSLCSSPSISPPVSLLRYGTRSLWLKHLYKHRYIFLGGLGAVAFIHLYLGAIVGGWELSPLPSARVSCNLRPLAAKWHYFIEGLLITPIPG